MLTAFTGTAVLAQETADKVKAALDEALKTYIVNVKPDKNCECNNCTHTYKDAFKITKRQAVAGTLRVWGVAKAYHKSQFTGSGMGTIEFYAELKKQGEEVSVSKFKWRKNDCMLYVTLLE